MIQNENKESFDICDCDSICIIPSCRPHNDCCKKCPIGPTGVTGPTGPTGITGATGVTGPTGQCSCNCIFNGELVANGGMEDIEEDKPTSWIFVNPDGVTSNDSQGRVHSGSYSVNIEDESSISQTIPLTEGGCYYRLSFFARAEGTNTGLQVNVIFNTTTGPVNAGSITVRNQDMTNSNRSFAFYQLITNIAPLNTTSITISFLVNSTGGQSIDIDDVSLTIA